MRERGRRLKEAEGSWEGGKATEEGQANVPEMLLPFLMSCVVVCSRRW
jgi:hypothetical protein